MDDFMKSLQNLNAADLSALGVAAPALPNNVAVLKTSPLRRRRERERKTAAKPSTTSVDTQATPNETAAPNVISPIPASTVPSPRTAKTAENTVQAGASVPTAISPTSAESGSSRTRTRPSREWPPIGTTLEAEYFGTTYRAEVVPAKKLLKSGKQLKLLDGPARGKRFDSYSRAMLAATAHQRKTLHLERRGMANGWSFWKISSHSPTTKPHPSV